MTDPAAMEFGPRRHLQQQLDDLPAGLPAIVMLGTGLTLVGAYTGTVQLLGVHDTSPATITPSVMVPACSCTDPDHDVDTDCPRHYPRPPAELVRVLALAVAASRGWAYGGIATQCRRRGKPGHDCTEHPGMETYPVDGADEADVAAALAVLEVLLKPGRNGVLPDDPSGR